MEFAVPPRARHPRWQFFKEIMAGHYHAEQRTCRYDAASVSVFLSLTLSHLALLHSTQTKDVRTAWHRLNKH